MEVNFSLNKQVKKFIAFPISIIYYLAFGITLVFFDVVQRICFFGFGYAAHKKSVDVLQFFLIRCLNIVGTSFAFKNPHQIPANKPLIIVANHQSMYDISPLIWYFKKHHPKFISKKELGKNIPSISFNLKYGGSVLIDRNSRKDAVAQIIDFAQNIGKNNWSAVIFPEGTRSKTGVPKPFQTTGLMAIFQNIPHAVVVPVTINNTHKINSWGLFPLNLGVKVQLQVHQPIVLSKYTDYNNLVAEIETTIKQSIQQ